VIISLQKLGMVIECAYNPTVLSQIGDFDFELLLFLDIPQHQKAIFTQSILEKL
jgi:hypothetical protein